MAAAPELTLPVRAVRMNAMSMSTRTPMTSFPSEAARPHVGTPGQGARYVHEGHDQPKNGPEVVHRGILGGSQDGYKRHLISNHSTAEYIRLLLRLR